MQAVIEAYGPYAFGLISLLILWRLIVQPQLKVQQSQSDALHITAEVLRDTSKINKEVTEELREIVKDLRTLGHQMRSK